MMISQLVGLVSVDVADQSNLARFFWAPAILFIFSYSRTGMNITVPKGLSWAQPSQLVTSMLWGSFWQCPWSVSFAQSTERGHFITIVSAVLGRCRQVNLTFFLFILFSPFCGVDVRWHTPPCSTVVHFLPRQSLLFDIILHFVQPIPLQPPLLDFLCDFLHFRRPLILSFLILSSLVIPTSIVAFSFLRPPIYFLCILQVCLMKMLMSGDLRSNFTHFG